MSAFPQNESPILPIEEYLPHRGRMVLLDRVSEVEEGRIVCNVDLRPDSPFCREGQAPAYVGIEYMAQTIGALIGWESRSRGEPVKTGFLIAVRKFISKVDGFAVGSTLIVEARKNWCDDEGLGVMDCTIYYPAGVRVAEARLMVFQPKDMEAYLKTI